MHLDCMVYAGGRPPDVAPRRQWVAVSHRPRSPEHPARRHAGQPPKRARPARWAGRGMLRCGG